MWWWFCNLFLSAFAVDNLSSLSGMNKVFCVVALLDQLMRVYSLFQAGLIPTVGYHTFTEGLWLWGGSPLSAKPCRPKLRSHKLSLCPPCGTVLIGVMRDDLNLHPAFKWTWFPFCNCSRYLWSSVINVCNSLLSEGFFGVFFSLCCRALRVWAKHCGPFSGFSRGALFAMFWLAEVTPVMQPGTLYTGCTPETFHSHGILFIHRGGKK